MCQHFGTKGEIAGKSCFSHIKPFICFRFRKALYSPYNITFSGRYAVETAQPVLYITERAVFELRPDGVTLIEIAPGIDLQTQVLDQMEFMPKIAPDLKLMDSRIFREEKMGLADDK